MKGAMVGFLVLFDGRGFLIYCFGNSKKSDTKFSCLKRDFEEMADGKLLPSYKEKDSPAFKKAVFCWK